MFISWNMKFPKECAYEAHPPARAHPASWKASEKVKFLLSEN